MRVLLVGEYSGVHTNLSLKLKSMGHDVITISNGDGYKSFPRDVDLKFKSFISKIKLRIFRITLSFLSDWLGISGLFNYLGNRKKIKAIRGFDVIQLINTAPIGGYSSIANYLLINDLLVANPNTKLFLCALGDDYSWVSASTNKEFRYSCFDRININNIHKYLYSYKYLYGLFYRQLDNFVIERSNAIIPGLLDYYHAYQGYEKLTSIVKIPLSQEQYDESVSLLKNGNLSVNTNISIFHGWQRGKEFKKGNDILDKVIHRIKNDDAISIKYNVVQNLPYDEYVEVFNDADIFLDQIYSYDRGVNAILGMAKGKVVISGFEGEEKYSVGINGVPDEDKLYESICRVCEDKNLLIKIKYNALNYIVNNHNPEDIANKYISIWISY